MLTTPVLNQVSAFAGIGGFDVGFARAGINTIAQIEKDPNAQTILARHFPGARLMGDIANVTSTDFRGLPRAQIWCGGFPCQDTSIAAPHRAGLAGSRSGHYFEFTRLVEEYGRLLADLDPRWVVIENPTGLLASHDGRDMATVVRVLEDLGYGWAYRVVDGRHFGSPQRRERVIVVGHRGGDPRPAWAVLGDTDPSTEALRSRLQRGPSSGPRPAGSPAGSAVVWRKSARPRAALTKGGYETWVADGRSNTLTGFDGGLPTRQTHLIAQDGRLRTLSLREWERLQAFDDDWTTGVPEGDLRRKNPVTGKQELVKAGRYTLLGNAMHVGMAEWLGHRIATVHQQVPQLEWAS